MTSTIVVAGLFSPWADLDHLEVRGLEGEPAEAVWDATGIAPGTAMFAVRPSEVRRRVEAIPWVAHADVDARWPDTVTVTVTPHRPMAVISSPEAVPHSPEAVPHSPEAVPRSPEAVPRSPEAVPRSPEAGDRVLTTAGVVLDRDDLGPLEPYAADVPRVSVDPVFANSRGAGAGAHEARSVLSQLRPITAGSVQRVEVGQGGSVSLGALLDGDGAPVELALGGTDDLPAKALALESVLSGTVELGCLARVDVSVPTRVTIQRAAGCTIRTPDDGA